MWISLKQKRRGFTLIELLVVIAIIGILSTVATVSLVQARRRARDTKRVSDIQQLRNALLIYANQRAVFPPATSDGPWSVNLGNFAEATVCLDDSDRGFHAGTANDPCQNNIIMSRVSREEFGGPPYAYEKTGPSSYAVSFALEGSLGNLPGGSCIANQDGITCP